MSEPLPYDPTRTFQIIGDTHLNLPDAYDQGDRNLLQLVRDCRDRGLVSLARLHVGDFINSVETGLDEDALARFAEIGDDVPLWVAMGNHDVQFDDRTPEQWAAALGYDSPSYALDFGFRRWLVMANADTNDTVSPATLAWLDAELAADSRPTGLLTHWPLVGTALGDPALYYETSSGWNIKPDAGIRAILDAHPHLDVMATGHVHGGESMERTPDYIKDENVGSRTLIHISASCPAYTGNDTITRRYVRSFFAEFLPATPLRIHIANHLTQGWMTDTAPYVVDHAPREPMSYFDGGTFGHQWDGAVDLSASRERVTPRLSAPYVGDRTQAIRQIMDSFSTA